MTDGAALLASVLAHPEDDAPRLVYADWCDENGQPERAEFIRVQIALSRMAKPSSADRKLATERLAAMHKGQPVKGRPGGRATLLAREAYLLDRHRAQWEPRGKPRLGCVWGKGFIREAGGELLAWLAHGRLLVTRQPVVRVEVTDRRPSAGHWELLGGDDVWAWFRAGHQTEAGGSDSLPPAVFDAMPGAAADGPPLWVKGYESPAEAMSALSAGLLAWAKGAAGGSPA